MVKERTIMRRIEDALTAYPMGTIDIAERAKTTTARAGTALWLLERYGKAIRTKDGSRNRWTLGKEDTRTRKHYVRTPETKPRKQRR